ncbi:MAG: ATP-binding domain-containing protein, partial [Prevotella sp.]|nr:ATP-binding domain-containing protein [Prevotella sp.]
AESGMNGDIFKNRDPESLSRQENIEEFVSGLQEFVDSQREEGNAEHVSLEDFIRDVSLMTDMDSSNANDGDRVVLMTVHSAKGLEFPTVFIVGMEENIFPSLMSMDSPRELEEERRLFYVAITRAEHRCIISCVQNRFRYGRMEFQTPSRFINDINPKLIDTQKGNLSSGKWSSYGESRGGIFGDNGRSDHFSDNRRYEKPAESIRYGKPADNGRIETSAGSFRSVSTLPSGGVSSAYSLSVGDMIEHMRFGIGRVMAIEGDGENTKATVEFSNLGTKQLLLKFAKFKKLT